MTADSLDYVSNFLDKPVHVNANGTEFVEQSFIMRKAKSTVIFHNSNLFLGSTSQHVPTPFLRNKKKVDNILKTFKESLRL